MTDIREAVGCKILSVVEINGYMIDQLRLELQRPDGGESVFVVYANFDGNYNVELNHISENDYEQ